MNTFLEYLFVVAVLGLVLLPSLIGHARDRAIERQLRKAAGRPESWRPTAASRSRAPAPARLSPTGHWSKAA